MMKQATRKPESRDENPRNRNPANPRAMDMSAWTQNPFDASHVSIPSFNALARAVPAESADSNRYANTWSWPKSNQTCKTSGKRVAPLEISQTEATISNREYRATIAFAANTNLKASKSNQRGEEEPRELVSMKTAEAREKEKEARRKTKMRELKRRSFCTESVEWKGVEVW